VEKAIQYLSGAGKTISMPESLREDHYTILTLEHLLLADGKFSLNTLLQLLLY
jgi:hypothetical protein